MAEKKYYIRVPEALVEVSKEIYVEFYRSERRLRTLEEKDQRNGLISYNAFDTDEGLGEEYVADLNSSSLEDLAIARLMQRKLRSSIEMLPAEDQELIHALFYEQMTEAEFGKRMGISQAAISKWKDRIIKKLQNYIN